MKRNLVAAILGLTVLTGVVESAKSQGGVAFENYGFTTFAPVTYTPGGAGVNNTFTAGLWYFLGTASLSTGSGSLPSGWELASVTQTFNSGATAGSGGEGLFVGPAAQIPDYVSGPITFVVTAYQGASYGTAISRGHSDAFTLNSISIPPSPVGEFGPGFKSFAIVPEPSIFALSGLSAAALLLIHRKK